MKRYKVLLIILLLIIVFIGSWLIWAKYLSGKIGNRVKVDVDANIVGQDISSSFKGINSVIFDHDFTPGGTYTYVQNWDYYKKDIGLDNHLMRLWFYANTFGNDPEALDPLLEDLQKNNGEVIISILGVPKEMSSNPNAADIKGAEAGPGYTTYPPKDPQRWADMVAKAVEHWNIDKKYKVKYFEFWNEPDGPYWQGTEEELFNLYKLTAEAIKRTDPKAKVGGLTFINWNKPQHWYEKEKFYSWSKLFPKSENGMLYKFIQYAKNNNVPLDFISWHSYSSDVNYGKVVIPKVRQWLNEAGFNKTETIIDEWGFGDDPGYLRDRPYGAASIANRIIDYSKAGLDRQSYFMMNDMNSQTDFDGKYFGVFSKNGVIKSSYNVLKMFDLLAENNLKTKVNSSEVKTIATKNDKKITLLMTNFSPQTDKKIRNLFSKKLSSKKVAINIEGLDQAKNYQLERYLIDTNHSNSYALKDKILSEIESSNKKALKAAKDFLLNNGISPEKIEQTVKVYNEDPTKIKEGFQNLSEDEKELIIEALKIYRETKAQEIYKINDSSEIKLAKVEEKTVQTAGSYQETMILAPYATSLIILTSVD